MAKSSYAMENATPLLSLKNRETVCPETALPISSLPSFTAKQSQQVHQKIQPGQKNRVRHEVGLLAFVLILLGIFIGLLALLGAVIGTAVALATWNGTWALWSLVGLIGGSLLFFPLMIKMGKIIGNKK